MSGRSGEGPRPCGHALAAALVAWASLTPVAGGAHAAPLAPQGSGICPDTSVEIASQSDPRGGVVLTATLNGVVEATLTLDLRLVNASASVPLPLTVDLEGRGPRELLRVRVNSRLREWLYTSRYQWRIGLRGGAHSDHAVYALPYERGRAYAVSQGRLGAQSHGPGSGAENALDFALPEGTTVRAARGGVVVAARDDSERGGPDPELAPCANYVIVRHADGTYAKYAHLKAHSLLVRLRERVEAGTPLGESGQTGYATGPHLHFEVYRNVDGGTSETLAVPFETSAGVLQDLAVGHEYRSPD